MKILWSGVSALILSTQHAAQAAEKKFVIGSDPWCPYQCFEGKTATGITLDLMKKVFEPLGYNVILVNTPWARAIQSLRDGDIATFGSAAKADAPEMIWASEPTTLMRNTIFKLKEDKWAYKDLNSLKEGTFGVIQSYTYGEEIDAYIKNNPKLIEATTGSKALESNVRKLLNKRVRFIIDDEAILKYTLAKMNASDKIEVAHQSSVVPLYFGFSPKNPEATKFAELTSKTIAKMKADGTLEKLFKKYGAKCLTCKE